MGSPARSTRPKPTCGPGGVARQRKSWAKWTKATPPNFVLAFIAKPCRGCLTARRQNCSDHDPSGIARPSPAVRGTQPSGCPRCQNGHGLGVDAGRLGFCSQLGGRGRSASVCWRQTARLSDEELSDFFTDPHQVVPYVTPLSPVPRRSLGSSAPFGTAIWGWRPSRPPLPRPVAGTNRERRGRRVRAAVSKPPAAWVLRTPTPFPESRSDRRPKPEALAARLDLFRNRRLPVPPAETPRNRRQVRGCFGPTVPVRVGAARLSLSTDCSATSFGVSGPAPAFLSAPETTQADGRQNQDVEPMPPNGDTDHVPRTASDVAPGWTWKRPSNTRRVIRFTMMMQSWKP